ncbi:hypothetical protein GCM10008090_15600 [Arenicella chitinivorans]|uniref:Uncharacterized protein n=1 Tax=Arenicella chitinivorans TaxID=1329800 RepID=A0A918RP20_9GAMM|nr:hypothetical protein [Arenicella chitinivorans]GHA06800.1 hypothetical protein GCM10008090_15600 [Arenicella chitinivorans]
MLKTVYYFGGVVLCLTPLSTSLLAQEYDPHALCQQAAEGLLPEDAATYIENCLSDYRANMGIEPAEPLGKSTLMEADSPDTESTKGTLDAAKDRP